MAHAVRAGSLPGALAGVHRDKESTRARDGESERLGAAGGLADAKSNRYEWAGELSESPRRDGAAHSGTASWLGDADNKGLAFGSRSADGERVIRFEGSALGAAEPVRGFWRGADWIYCRDGKYRPVEPGTFPLAHGATSRVGRLRAYGNCINTEAARVFIQSAAETIEVYDLI
jgi:DNA (cytosine-5)-methyltransferase 1